MYRKISCCVIIMLCIALPAISLGFEPLLKSSVKIQASSVDINVGSYAIPRISDWNNDGRKDLLIGQRTDGKVRLYINSGTDAAPVFSAFTFIQANGSDLSVYGTGCQGSSPEVVDWNNDGKKDLLVGDAAGVTFLYINGGTDAAPILGAGTQIQVDGTNFSVGARAVPCINDWDEDSRKDLLIGRGDGEISVLLNTNTDADPVFDVDDRVYADLVVLDGGLRVAPRIFDWNRDGYKDIVTGEGYGKIFFYENIKTNDDPEFSATKVNLKAGGLQIDVGYRSRAEIVDWNNDTAADILVGSSDGCVYYYEQLIFRFVNISYDSSTGTTLEWNSRPGDTYTVYFSTDLVQWNELQSGVVSGGDSTVWTDSGSVSFDNRCYRIGVDG